MKTIPTTTATPIVKARDLRCECTDTRCEAHRRAFNVRRRGCTRAAEYIAQHVDATETTMCLDCASHWSKTTGLIPARVGAVTKIGPRTLDFATYFQALRLESIQQQEVRS